MDGEYDVVGGSDGDMDYLDEDEAEEVKATVYYDSGRGNGADVAGTRLGTW